MDLIAFGFLREECDPLSTWRPFGRQCSRGWFAVQRDGFPRFDFEQNDIEPVQVVEAAQDINNGLAIWRGSRLPVVAKGIGREGAGPAAIDVGQEQLIRFIAFDCDDQSMRIWQEARTACTGGKVRDLLRQTSRTRHKMDVSVDAEGDPFAIWRPDGDLVIPVVGERAVGGEPGGPTSVEREQVYVGE